MLLPVFSAWEIGLIGFNLQAEDWGGGACSLLHLTSHLTRYIQHKIFLSYILHHTPNILHPTSTSYNLHLTSTSYNTLHRTPNSDLNRNYTADFTKTSLLRSNGDVLRCLTRTNRSVSLDAPAEAPSILITRHSLRISFCIRVTQATYFCRYWHQEEAAQ